MKTIIYKFCDGTAKEVEVSDELGAVIAEIERETENNDKREMRRHISLEWAAEREDTEIPDNRVEVEDESIKRREISKLRTAMKTLTPNQKELIRKVFFKGKTLTAVAVENGVSYQAIQGRLYKIYRKLRKNLCNGVS